MQHLMQIDLKGWGAGYIPSFQQHCLLQMLNSVAGEFLCYFLFVKFLVVIDIMLAFLLSDARHVALLFNIYTHFSLCFGSSREKEKTLSPDLVLGYHSD